MKRGFRGAAPRRVHHQTRQARQPQSERFNGFVNIFRSSLGTIHETDIFARGLQSVV